MIQRLFIICTIASVISCKSDQTQNYYPEKVDEMSFGIYGKYKSKLDTAYDNGDMFEASIQLANLKASSGKVFPNMEIGIKSNPDNCLRIFEWYEVYTKHDFQNNIVKTDTTAFKNTFTLCEQLLGKQAYPEYLLKKEQAHQERMAARSDLDSSKFDLALIEKLHVIMEDDQKYRKMLTEKGVNDVEKDPLWKKQKALDSINLQKVIKILEDGYPTKEQVGYEPINVIWFVLHHQSDYETRQKYLPILKQANEDGILGDGAIKTFEWRDELILLNSKEGL